jgi:hypothetical protein
MNDYVLIWNGCFVYAPPLRRHDLMLKHSNEQGILTTNQFCGFIALEKLSFIIILIIININGKFYGVNL